MPIIHAGCLNGVEVRAVEVEVHVGKGLPGFDIVGLPEAAVRESHVRVRSAIASCGVELPPRRVIVNLAPADLRKTGSAFDLAIATGVLAAVLGELPEFVSRALVLGELSLGGAIRRVRGVLPFVANAQTRGLGGALVPQENAAEARLISSLDVRCASHLAEVIALLKGDAVELARPSPDTSSARPRPSCPDLMDVRGQDTAKRVLEIAAAGRHNTLLVGPPGAGKTMLAQRLPGLLPRPDADEALEIASIASAAGHPVPSSLDDVERPFRNPHHQSSAAALLGGGHPVRPGEVTLAHRGVLFLDELPEFRRDAIEGLRTVMEAGVITLSRVRQRVTMPARTVIVAAMNPCPCGFAGDAAHLCTCSPERVARYAERISGPIFDRFDLHVRVARVKLKDLQGEADPTGESSETVRDRVEASQRFREQRLRKHEPTSTRKQSGELVSITAHCTTDAVSLLNEAYERSWLSARGYLKTLRVARTIADLDGNEELTSAQVAEALQYRPISRRTGAGT